MYGVSCRSRTEKKERIPCRCGSHLPHKNRMCLDRTAGTAENGRISRNETEEMKEEMRKKRHRLPLVCGIIRAGL